MKTLTSYQISEWKATGIRVLIKVCIIVIPIHRTYYVPLNHDEQPEERRNGFLYHSRRIKAILRSLHGNLLLD